MFVVLLRFSVNKTKAGQFMDAHNAWLKEGFSTGMFLMAGSLQPALGGALLVHDATREQVQAVVDRDPFVSENIVAAEIIEITPSKADPRLGFLLPTA